MLALEFAAHRILGPRVVDEGRALEPHDAVEIGDPRTAHQHAHCSTRFPGDGVTSGARR